MKTPEEMAEKFADSGLYRLKRYVDGRVKFSQGERGLQNRACKYGFLAGYQAAAPQWISVKDRLPKAYKLVLCCAVGKLDTTYGYIEEDKTWTCNDEPKDSLTKIDHISFITHWMPLPAAPKEEV
jgi:hypothetical protein